jgi:hypothetical protein
LRHRAGVIAALQKFFALEQRARTRRRAARNEQGKREEKQKTKMEDGRWPPSRRSGAMARREGGKMKTGALSKNSILQFPSSTLAFVFGGQHRRWW